jgi:hypothetical protein
VNHRLLHFSEDPTIKTFRPHVARTSTEVEPFVWALDEEHAPSYWFPRDCPRACCWEQGGSRRWHAIEDIWLERMQACRLYAYEFDPAPFRPKIPGAGYWVATEEVPAVCVTLVGDLLRRHAEAGIELRIVANLWPSIDSIMTSGLEFSIIRKTNAKPRRTL